MSAQYCRALAQIEQRFGPQQVPLPQPGKLLAPYDALNRLTGKAYAQDDSRPPADPLQTGALDEAQRQALHALRSGLLARTERQTG